MTMKIITAKRKNNSLEVGNRNSLFQVVEMEGDQRDTVLAGLGGTGKERCLEDAERGFAV